MGITNQPPDLLPGTLDLLILRTLTRGAQHGYGIADRIRLLSADVLQVGESSLYPALQRLLLNGWVSAEWGASENNRRARYYTITAEGRKRLTSERKEFQRIVSGHPAGPRDRVNRPCEPCCVAPGPCCGGSGWRTSSPRSYRHGEPRASRRSMRCATNRGDANAQSSEMASSRPVPVPPAADRG